LTSQLFSPISLVLKEVRTTIAASKLQRVKATHGATCGEHSMTHLARYPATRLEVTRRYLWRTFHDTLGEVSRDETGDHTADDFASFFEDKVDGVRASTASTPIYDVPYRATPTLEDWTAVTAEEIQKLISSAPNKTCELDPAPTWLVKDMRRLLSPFLSLLINKSLTAGCFPVAFKEASVRLLLKKVGLDAGDQKSFRPVSILPFLSKLLERVVQARLL